MGYFVAQWGILQWETNPMPEDENATSLKKGLSFGSLSGSTYFRWEREIQQGENTPYSSTNSTAQKTEENLVNVCSFLMTHTHTPLIPHPFTALPGMIQGT